MQAGSFSAAVRGLTAILLSMACLNIAIAEEPLTDEEIDAILEYTDQNDIDLDDVELLSPPHYEIDTEFGDFINARLAESELDVQLSFAETYTAISDPESMGRIVFFNDRTALIPYRFVPGDQRRTGWSGDVDFPDDITSMIDPSIPEGHPLPTVGAAAAVGAITRATNTWNALESANIPINQDGPFGAIAPIDLGRLQNALGYGGHPFYIAADILHGGFLPPGFFDDVFGTGAGASILGVAYFYHFVVPGTATPTDIDGNGMLDAAHVEIYYNSGFNWGIDTIYGYDVETTALHEVGHALCLPHVGMAFRTPSNGKLHVAPRAAMNAGYIDLLQEPTGRDIGLFSEIWATWPQQ